MDSTRKMLEATNAPENTSYEKSPLEKHIESLGGQENGDISYASIKQKNEKLGDSPVVAALTAATVMTAAGIKIHGCPFTTFKAKEAIGVLNHPYSTRIFNLDGSINLERWNELLTYTEKNEDGKSIITETNFYRFLTSCRQRETRSDPMSLGYHASNGEWRSFFDKFSNGMKNNIRYITVNRLQKFYEDSKQVVEKIEHKLHSNRQ